MQKDIPLLAAGTCLESISLYRSKFVHNEPGESEIKNLKRENVNPAERRFIKNNSEKAGRASDITRDAARLPVILLPVQSLFNRQWGNVFTLGIMYLEVLMIEQGAAGTVKSISDRMRPFMYNEELPYENKKSAAENGTANKSFYSGHTSTAFSSVVFFAKVFGDLYPESAMTPCIWGGGLLLASATAYLRVAAGMHFPSDVFAGAVMGSIIGYAVPCLHYNKTAQVSIFPVINEMIGFGVIINI